MAYPELVARTRLVTAEPEGIKFMFRLPAVLSGKRVGVAGPTPTGFAGGGVETTVGTTGGGGAGTDTLWTNPPWFPVFWIASSFVAAPSPRLTASAKASPVPPDISSDARDRLARHDREATGNCGNWR